MSELKTTVENTNQETKHVGLNKKDVFRFFFRWYWLAEVSYNYERMQGMSVAGAMLPALKKLWKKDEDLQNALRRESAYFNTEAIWGSPSLALALSMEEEYANMPEGSVTYDEIDSSINGIKTGLMGPLAGIGDTMDWAVLQVLFLTMGMDIARTGNWIGALIPIPFIFLSFGIGWFLSYSTYTVGKGMISKLLSTGLIGNLLLGAGIVGNFMMGTLASNTLKLSLVNESTQGVVDSIVPGLMPVCAFAIIYYCLAVKKIKASYVSYGIIIISLLLSLTGLF